MTENRPQQLTSRIARHAAFFCQGGVAIVTYLHEGRQYIVISVGGGGQPAELVALALPQS